MPRSEDVAVRRGRLERLPFLAVRQAFRDFAFQAAAQADQALAVLREQVLVDPRLVVEALGVAGRHQLDQVVVALERFGQQHQVVLRLAGIAALGPPVSRSHVDLAPENRLDAARAGVVVEDHRRKQVAVLGHGEGRHLQLHRLIEHFIDPARAVEQRVFGVQVKMNEVHYSHSIVDGGFELMS